MREEKKINVVILDDVKENLVELTKIVDGLGYIARPVITIKQAVLALKKCEPTVLLLDIAMPEMSGFDFLKRIKAQKEYSKIPVIFISAYQDKETIMEAYAIGAADYIIRPFVAEEVACRIKRQVISVSKLEQKDKEISDLKQLLSYKMDLRNQDKQKVMHALYYIAKEQEQVLGRMERVTTNAVALARALGFMPEYEKEVSEEFLHRLEEAAPLYDFGMLMVKEEIRFKKGALSKEERMEVRQHTTRGLEPLILLLLEDEENEYLNMAVDLGMYHHERFDGNGYPYGLSGNDIPLVARIMAIISVFDALIHDTCYRMAYSESEALKIIKEEAGKGFDPTLVHAFEVVYQADQLDKGIV